MYNKKIEGIRRVLLLWLQPIILLLLGIVFLFTIETTLPGSFERRAYFTLIGILFIITSTAFVATLKNHYKISSVMTVFLSFVGSWGAIYIDSQHGITEFFPLVYVTINVLLSSVLLSLPFTMTIAVSQLISLVFLIFRNPVLLAQNWPSFTSYVFIASVICIATNYISSNQLKLFKESSIRDHLTGLPNRRYFDVTLEEKFNRGLSKGHTYGVMLIDIDKFKRYNDLYDHATGDTVLQRVGSFLQDRVDHQQSIVCRYGGDEFAGIFPTASMTQLKQKAESLKTGIKEVDITDICQPGEQLALSIGLAIFPENGKNVASIMSHADKNLILSKGRYSR